MLLLIFHVALDGRECGTEIHVCYQRRHVLTCLSRRFQNLKKTYAAYYCEPELLNAAIPYLPNLDTIDISLDNCPFDPTDEVWPRVWEFPTTRLLQRVLTTQRTTDILLATRPLPSPNANAKGIQTPINPKILTLTHSRLPLEFFTQPPRTFSSVVNSFTNLRALSLNLDYSPFPNDRYLIESFQGLGRCLSEAFSLQSLSLAYWGQTNPQLNIDVIFGSKTMWKQLHTFRLTGVKIVVEDLLGFLHRQKGTIKRLGIGGKGQGINRYGAYETMDFGSRIGFRDLCHGIRELVADGAILEKFNVMKNLRSTSGGSALSSRYAQLYDEEWQRVGEDDSWAHQVESFVLRCGRKPVHGFWHADAESEEADLVEMTQMFNDTAIYE